MERAGAGKKKMSVDIWGEGIEVGDMVWFER